VSDEFRYFVPFAKVESQADGTVIVEGPVTSEAVDTEDEVVDYEAIKAASTDYMQFANMREMHDPHTASGTMLNLDFDDDNKRIVGRSHAVDPGVVKKILTGVYKGYSIGGRKLAWNMEKQGGKSVRRLTKLWWGETSYVDRPSNPEAVFTLAKRDYTADEPQKETEPVAKSEKTAVEPIAKADNPFPPKGDDDTGDNPEKQQGEAQDQAAGGPPFPPGNKTSKAKKSAKSAKKRMGAVLAKMDTLAKGGNKTVKHLLAAIEEITCAIAEEAEEGDTEGVGDLQGLLNTAMKVMSAEAAEGEPADDEEDGEMEPEPLMDADASDSDLVEMAAQIKSLRKAEARKVQRKVTKLQKQARFNRKTLAKVAALADKTPAVVPPDAAGVDPLEKAAGAIDDLMAKVGGTVTQADLVLVKAEVLEALSAAKEDLAKTIAAQPMSGGPLAVPDLSRFGSDAADMTQDAILAKAVQGMSDPIAKEALGKFAAAESIRQQQQGR
jgi:hypothetical protein